MAKPQTQNQQAPQSNAVAVLGAPIFEAQNGKKFALVSRVNLPLLKHKDGDVHLVKFISEIFTGKDMKAADGADPAKKKAPARLAKIIDLDSGRECQYIVGAVLESELVENFPDGAYVNKSFAIRKLGKVEGKNYGAWDVALIAEQEPDAA